MGSLTGCNRGPASVPGKASPPAVANSAAVEPAIAAASPEATPEQPQPAPDEPLDKPPTADAAKPTDDPSSKKDEPAPEEKVASEPEKKPENRERIAILTPGGPLLVDIRLTLDGHPYLEGVEAKIKEVLEAADTNHDSRATWKELVDNASFIKAQSPQSPQAPEVNARQKKMWIEQYDVNRDDYVDRDEAAAWLGRDAGRTARAFAVRSSRSYAPDPRSTSRLWTLLDADGDGRLSLEEVRALPASLLRLDEDDDQVITQEELIPLQEQLAEANSQGSSRSDDHYAALQLEADADLARVDYLLTDMYAPRQDLSPQSFSAFPALADKLDANGDDWLDREELEELLKTKASLDLSVAFTEANGSEHAAGRLHVDDHAAEVSVVGNADDRIVLKIGAARLIISARDLAPPASDKPGSYAADRQQIRLMVHDQVDALFDELDENGDGRLGSREIATGPGRLLGHDADRNGVLSSDEVPYVMIAAFMRSEPSNEQSYYVPTTSPAAVKADLAPGWFRRADFNGDGDVSRREFLGSAPQFDALDANRDGFIELKESARTPSR